MLFRELLKRDFKLVELVVARLVDARRLAGRPHELAGKEIRQRGMVLPVGHQALQQIGTSQKRTVRRRGAAQGDMIAPACARMAAIQHEFFGAQPRLARFLVQRRRGSHQLAPG